MEYTELNELIWDELKNRNKDVQGYDARFLEIRNQKPESVLVFQDENNIMHCIIKTDLSDKNRLINLNINGLELNLSEYRIKSVGTNNYIDIKSKLVNYKKQFSTLIQEICEKILRQREDPITAVNSVLNTWKIFWTNINSTILSTEEQLGLLGELYILKKFLNIHAQNSLNSWKGPFGLNYDFVFSKWAIEVKITRNPNHIHCINGINQLDNFEGLNLGLVSIIALPGDSEDSMSLQSLIEEIQNDLLCDQPDLEQQFYDLLNKAGYNKTFQNEYSANKYTLLDARFYVIDDNFPKITKKSFKKEISNQIFDIRYMIDLSNLSCIELNKLPIGNYCY